ncbi:MAG: PD-(D/E)XK nuclease family protein [Alphaproteobacteria bacterium]|nr:PD-(D/E)XK nuclease family protein [Rickettsiales bacterium]
MIEVYKFLNWHPVEKALEFICKGSNKNLDSNFSVNFDRLKICFFERLRIRYFGKGLHGLYGNCCPNKDNDNNFDCSLMINYNKKQIESVLFKTMASLADKNLLINFDAQEVADAIWAVQLLFLHKVEVKNINLGVEYFQSRSKNILGLILESKSVLDAWNNNVSLLKKKIDYAMGGTTNTATSKQVNSQLGNCDDEMVFMCYTQLDFFHLMAVLKQINITRAKVCFFSGVDKYLFSSKYECVGKESKDNLSFDFLDSKAAYTVSDTTVKNLFCNLDCELKNTICNCCPKSIVNDTEVRFIDFTGLKTGYTKSSSCADLSFKTNGNIANMVNINNAITAKTVFVTKQNNSISACDYVCRTISCLFTDKSVNCTSTVKMSSCEVFSKGSCNDLPLNSEPTSASVVSVICNNSNTVRFVNDLLCLQNDLPYSCYLFNNTSKNDDSFKNLNLFKFKSKFVLFSTLFLPQDCFTFVKNLWSFWKKFCISNLNSLNNKQEKFIAGCKCDDLLWQVVSRAESWQCFDDDFVVYLENFISFYNRPTSKNIWPIDVGEVFENVLSYFGKINEISYIKNILFSQEEFDMVNKIIDSKVAINFRVESENSFLEICNNIVDIFKFNNFIHYCQLCQPNELPQQADRQKEVKENNSSKSSYITDFNNSFFIAGSDLIFHLFNETDIPYIFGTNTFEKFVLSEILGAEELFKWSNCERLTTYIANAKTVCFILGNGLCSDDGSCNTHRFLRYIEFVKRNLGINIELKNLKLEEVELVDNANVEEFTNSHFSYNKKKEDSPSSEICDEIQYGSSLANGEIILQDCGCVNVPSLELYPTSIAMLIENPFSFYSKYIMHLNCKDDVISMISNPIIKSDDADFVFGNAVHKGCEKIAYATQRDADVVISDICISLKQNFSLDVSHSFRLEGFLLEVKDFLKKLRSDGYNLFPEIKISTVLSGNIKVAARPDLIAVKDGAAIILDYKTGKTGSSFTDEVKGKSVQMSIAAICLLDPKNFYIFNTDNISIDDFIFFTLLSNEGVITANEKKFSRSKYYKTKEDITAFVLSAKEGLTNLCNIYFSCHNTKVAQTNGSVNNNGCEDVNGKCKIMCQNCTKYIKTPYNWYKRVNDVKDMLLLHDFEIM